MKMNKSKKLTKKQIRNIKIVGMAMIVLGAALVAHFGNIKTLLGMFLVQLGTAWRMEDWAK